MEANIDPIARLTATIKIANVKLNGEIGLPEFVDVEVDYYDGIYVVKPTFQNNVLPTANKLLEDDVTVEAIEVARTSNPQGGKTVYIGGII